MIRFSKPELALQSSRRNVRSTLDGISTGKQAGLFLAISKIAKNRLFCARNLKYFWVFLALYYQIVHSCY